MQQADFIGKNILFITPEFFNVDKAIMDKLREYGATVQWIDERSVKSGLGRAINSVCPGFFYQYSRNYYKQEIKKIDAKIDIILVIKGEMISKKTLEEIKSRFPKAKVILYLYDSLKNIRGIKNKIKYYDEVYSFDRLDCERYGMTFRPLFCDIKEVRHDEQKKYKYDICFYGTVYGDRFEIIDSVKSYCSHNGMSFYSFCYLRAKFMCIFYFLTNSGFRKLGTKGISFVPKTLDEIAEIVTESNTILDANDRKQTGLTIRTLETLLSGKKLITTNSDIINYDLYNKNNICVIDREDINIPKEFIDKRFEPLDEKVRHRYTVEGWIEDVFKN